MTDIPSYYVYYRYGLKAVRIAYDEDDLPFEGAYFCPTGNVMRENHDLITEMMNSDDAEEISAEEFDRFCASS